MTSCHGSRKRSAASTLQSLLEDAGLASGSASPSCSPAPASLNFQRQDISHLRSFFDFLLRLPSSGAYGHKDAHRAQALDQAAVLASALSGVNDTSDARSMQQALYRLYCNHELVLCQLLLAYVAELTGKPSGQQTKTVSASTLEHKIRRLTLFLRLAQHQSTSADSTKIEHWQQQARVVNLLDRYHPVWKQLYVAVHSHGTPEGPRKRKMGDVPRSAAAGPKACRRSGPPPPPAAPPPAAAAAALHAVSAAAAETKAAPCSRLAAAAAALQVQALAPCQVAGSAVPSHPLPLQWPLAHINMSHLMQFPYSVLPGHLQQYAFKASPADPAAAIPIASTECFAPDRSRNGSSAAAARSASSPDSAADTTTQVSAPVAECLGIVAEPTEPVTDFAVSTRIFRPVARRGAVPSFLAPCLPPAYPGTVGTAAAAAATGGACPSLALHMTGAGPAAAKACLLYPGAGRAGTVPCHWLSHSRSNSTASLASLQATGISSSSSLPSAASPGSGAGSGSGHDSRYYQLPAATLGSSSSLAVGHQAAVPAFHCDVLSADQQAAAAPAPAAAAAPGLCNPAELVLLPDAAAAVPAAATAAAAAEAAARLDAAATAEAAEAAGQQPPVPEAGPAATAVPDLGQQLPTMAPLLVMGAADAAGPVEAATQATPVAAPVLPPSPQAAAASSEMDVPLPLAAAAPVPKAYAALPIGPLQPVALQPPAGPPHHQLPSTLVAAAAPLPAAAAAAPAPKAAAALPVGPPPHLLASSVVAAVRLAQAKPAVDADALPADQKPGTAACAAAAAAAAGVLRPAGAAACVGTVIQSSALDTKGSQAPSIPLTTAAGLAVAMAGRKPEPEAGPAAALACQTLAATRAARVQAYLHKRRHGAFRAHLKYELRQRAAAVRARVKGRFVSAKETTMSPGTQLGQPSPHAPHMAAVK